MSRQPARTGPIVAFVVIVIGLSWSRFLPLVADTPPLVDVLVTAVGTLAPVLAAVAVIAWSSGRHGVGQLLRQATRWRIHPAWYAAGLLVPGLLYGSALAGYTRLGGVAPHFDGAILTMIPVIVVAGLAVALLEELGWRGWLQQTVQTRVSAPVAALFVGVVWGLWHAPLHATPGVAQADIPVTLFILLTMGVSVCLAALYNATAGSVPAAAVAHVGFNLAVGSAVLALPEAAGTFVAVCTAVTAALALAVAAANRTAPPHPRPGTPVGHPSARSHPRRGGGRSRRTGRTSRIRNPLNAPAEATAHPADLQGDLMPERPCDPERTCTRAAAVQVRR